MRFTVSDKAQVLPIVSAFLYLGYEACGGTQGRGFLQAAEGVTKDNILRICPPPRKLGETNGVEIYGDYVAGRMMKTSICFSVSGGWVEVDDSPVRPDYQGWGRKYKTYLELLQAAAKLCGMTVGETDVVPDPNATPAPAVEASVPKYIERTPEEIKACVDAHPITVTPVNFV